jgi:hypothetical protein
MLTPNVSCNLTLNAAWSSGDMMNWIASRATWTSRLLGGLSRDDDDDGDDSSSSRGMSDCECEIAISDGSDGDAGGDGVWGMACFVLGVTGFCLVLGAGAAAAGI